MPAFLHYHNSPYTKEHSEHSYELYFLATLSSVGLLRITPTLCLHSSADVSVLEPKGTESRH